MVRVQPVDVNATLDLRRRVLRSGMAAPVRIAADGDPAAWHLGVVEGEAVVAVGSFYPGPTPHRPGARAVQLRFMAVEPDRQGRGLGRALIDAAVARLRAEGVRVLWANARDTAIGFYERMGFRVHGEGFVHAPTGLGHHVVVLDLDSDPDP